MHIAVLIFITILMSGCGSRVVTAEGVQFFDASDITNYNSNLSHSVFSIVEKTQKTEKLIGTAFLYWPKSDTNSSVLITAFHVVENLSYNYFIKVRCKDGPKLFKIDRISRMIENIDMAIVDSKEFRKHSSKSKYKPFIIEKIDISDTSLFYNYHTAYYIDEAFLTTPMISQIQIKDYLPNHHFFASQYYIGKGSSGSPVVLYSNNTAYLAGMILSVFKKKNNTTAHLNIGRILKAEIIQETSKKYLSDVWEKEQSIIIKKQLKKENDLGLNDSLKVYPQGK
ncbi:MAG: hypothetical protein COB99_07135 [Sulfurimonas sp.]|nr:MAG: hypothetical protein COB99_07135 [Sulfurimonas sp.]